MKTKLLIFSAALFSLITISCKSDATKCVDNMIETLANAKSVEDLEKLSSDDNFSLFFSFYKPRYDNGEEYKQYMHDVVNEFSDRFDEFRAAGKNNKYLKGFSSASESEMKERCESLHEWINEAEVSIDENKVTIENGWEVITFSKD